jgi:aquaporin Z
MRSSSARLSHAPPILTRTPAGAQTCTAGLSKQAVLVTVPRGFETLPAPAEEDEMKKYATEFIGTFFLVLTVCLTVMGGSSMAPLAIGASLMIMVYMGGHISGGHYNPAVSLAALMSRRLDASEFWPYVGSQLLGSIVASAIAFGIMRRSFAPAPGAEVPAFTALVVEFIFTFALCLVVLNVATAKKTAGNSYYGLAIGFTIVVAAFAGGGISGGAFNPAVGTGPTLVKAVSAHGSLAHLWLYIVGPCLGAAAASRVFDLQEAKA